MSNNQRRGFRGASVGDFIAPDQMAAIKAFANGPQTLEGKLALFLKLAQEHEVQDRKNPNRKDKRSRLGTFVNRLFNTELVLPSVGRRQQIGKAIKYAKEYLIEHPDVSVYYAAAMGAAQEYREWKALVGDLTEEQQMAIVTSETPEHA